MFNNVDSLDNIGTVNQSDTVSYFKKDTLGISVSVSNAEGDHAEFEIKKWVPPTWQVASLKIFICNLWI